jgi:SAM-dependent methyltransferase
MSAGVSSNGAFVRGIRDVGRRVAASPCGASVGGVRPTPAARPAAIIRAPPDTAIRMTSPTLKLDLGCGVGKKEGFFGVDISPESHADLVLDLRTTPWPWADGSVAEIHCAHFFEHLDANERIRFLGEVHRILAPGAKATIRVPHARSDGAVQDPTHAWPPLVEKSFAYFSREAREQLRVPHYAFPFDFGVEVGVVFTPQWATRTKEERHYALAHFHNVASEIVAVLTKR